MKKIILSLFVLMLLFSSCSSPSERNTFPDYINSAFTVKVTGTAYGTDLCAVITAGEYVGIAGEIKSPPIAFAGEITGPEDEYNTPVREMKIIFSSPETLSGVYARRASDGKTYVGDGSGTEIPIEGDNNYINIADLSVLRGEIESVTSDGETSTVKHTYNGIGITTCTDVKSGYPKKIFTSSVYLIFEEFEPVLIQ